jgi:hypothetical protein
MKTLTLKNKIITEKAFNYSITAFLKTNLLEIEMNMTGGIFYTSSYPETSDILKKRAPFVFKTHCENDLDLTFFEEAKNTELPHLFEHLILAFLKEICPSNKLRFSGYTSWDWSKNIENYGKFYIRIEGTKLEKDKVIKAIISTQEVFDEIISSEKFECDVVANENLPNEISLVND